MNIKEDTGDRRNNTTKIYNLASFPCMTLCKKAITCQRRHLLIAILLALPLIVLMALPVGKGLSKQS